MLKFFCKKAKVVEFTNASALTNSCQLKFMKSADVRISNGTTTLKTKRTSTVELTKK